jgi:hypothetical protein
MGPLAEVLPVLRIEARRHPIGGGPMNVRIYVKGEHFDHASMKDAQLFARQLAKNGLPFSASVTTATMRAPLRDDWWKRPAFGSGA